MPLYEFSGEGEHLILHIRKKGLSTQEMLKIISEQTGIKMRDIGYAGMKDKQAMTTQYLSVPKKSESTLAHLSHDAIKILETTAHKNKLRLGHLKGNRFFIRLKKVLPVESRKITQALSAISESGMPNYFGYQRFGREGDNPMQGKEILDGVRQQRNKKINRFLISAYQSLLFNQWLSKRIEISRILGSFSASESAQALEWDQALIQEIQQQASFFKLLPGEKMHHYPLGKVYELQDLKAEAERYAKKESVPAGMLSGKRVRVAEGLAGKVEAAFTDSAITESGDRRLAWVFPQEIEGNYREENAHFELNFTLPKGSYATVLIESIANQEITPSKPSEPSS